MSKVLKITYGRVDLMNRNLQEIKREEFNMPTEEVIERLFNELGDSLWNYMEYKEGNIIDISYPCFDNEGKYTEEEITWLIEED